VLGRGGAGSSPNRSIAGCCLCGGGAGRLELVPRRCDADRSICTFSCTFFKGCSLLAVFLESSRLALTISSSSVSRVEGSGIGPSIVQRFDSYFVRMKFSIFASDGTCPGASFASQYLFARAFPHFSTLCNCSSVHVSRSTDFTLLMCVPIPRCMPEQRMQIKTPRFQLAHRGSVAMSAQPLTMTRYYLRLFLLQSEHVLLPSSFTRFFRVARFCSARSAAGLGRRDMVG
jgi:hypothetical protein